MAFDEHVVCFTTVILSITINILEPTCTVFIFLMVRLLVLTLGEMGAYIFSVLEVTGR